jgi:transposase
MGKEAKYVVRLSEAEHVELAELVARGRASASVRQRALILLKANVEGPAWTDEQIAEFAQVGRSTVHRARQRCVEEGLEGALRRKPSPQRQYRKLDGVQEAKLVALACSDPPAGRVCWTMQLLADKLVELDIVDSIGREAVRVTLKKTRCIPGGGNTGCCLPNKTPTLSARWKMFSKSTSVPTIRGGRSSASTNKASN